MRRWTCVYGTARPRAYVRQRAARVEGGQDDLARLRRLREEACVVAEEVGGEQPADDADGELEDGDVEVGGEVQRGGHLA